jgi:hypothetical protein
MNLTEMIRRAVELVPEVKQYLDDAVLNMLADVKSYDYYGGRLEKYAGDYYSGKINDTEFLDRMIGMVSSQLRKAWNEGMRENGLDPSRDMNSQWAATLQGIVNSEYNHITDLADFINQQRSAMAGTDAIMQRVGLWQNRYIDVTNQAIIETAKKDDLYEWQFGNTEKHCDTCLALNGVIAPMVEWDERGLHPQNPPNGSLQCGGWQCDCRFVKSDGPITEGGIPNV